MSTNNKLINKSFLPTVPNGETPAFRRVYASVFVDEIGLSEVVTDGSTRGGPAPTCNRYGVISGTNIRIARDGHDGSYTDLLTWAI